MGYRNAHERAGRFWVLVARQYGVIAHAQLLALGFSAQAIKRRVASGRLYRVRLGVYAVGRPDLSRHGRWMAAILRCGERAMLSHRSAAALWGIEGEAQGKIEISVIIPRSCRGEADLVVHRRVAAVGADATEHDGIAVTTPAATLIDLATCLPPYRVEGAVNKADKRGLIDPEAVRVALEERRPRRGVGPLRNLLDRHTFVLTDSELERRFVPLARRAGLPKPLTGKHLSGFEVDFYWPDLGLVVETDGLRYHRTPAQQARDRVRDQAHTAAGMTPLRFTHAQIRFEPGYVGATLARVARRLAARSPGS